MSIVSFSKPFTRRTPEQWQQIIADQQQSGLSQKAFCLRHGLCLATFSNWKRDLAPPQDNSDHVKPVNPDWIEVPTNIADTSHPGWDIGLELPGGITLRMRQSSCCFLKAVCVSGRC